MATPFASSPAFATSPVMAGSGMPAPATGGWFDHLPATGPLAAVLARTAPVMRNAPVIPPSMRGPMVPTKQGTPRVTQTSVQPDAHPCKSGGDCGCGGTCGGKNREVIDAQSSSSGMRKDLRTGASQTESSKVISPALTNNFRITAGNGVPTQVDYPAIKTTPSGPQESIPKMVSMLDASKPGNLLTLSVQYDTGVTETIISEVESPGLVRVRINDTTNGRNLMDIRYHAVGGMWLLNSRKIVATDKANLAQFALGAWISMFVARTRFNLDEQERISHQYNQSQTLSALPPPPHRGTEVLLGGGKTRYKTLPVDPLPCMPHDLVCSFPSIPLPEYGFSGPKVGGLEGDKKTLILVGFACIGAVEVNIEDCCFAHDIAYWCAKDSDLKEKADKTVWTCPKLMDSGFGWP